MGFSLFGRRNKPAETAASNLYQQICAAARHPALYAEGFTPDSIDGRFESIALHTHLVLRRLSSSKADPEVGQALFDVLFADMDQSLREIGTSDVVIGKEIKRMAQGFFGRAEAYEHGLMAEDDSLLMEAIRRNLLATQTGPHPQAAAQLARYCRAQAAHLDTLPAPALSRGQVSFAEPAIDPSPMSA